MSLGMCMKDMRNAESYKRSTLHKELSTNMYYYGREVCFILAIVFTTYAALHNAPPKVSKSPPAVPFFPKTSLVADFYHGQLLSAFQRVMESDVSLVMYYAPWDAESQTLREQFRSAAQYYYREVFFAAINCWNPNSECKQYFAKVHHFPVVIAYTQLTKGIEYKGIKESAHMIRFLQHVLRPIERIETPDDINRMMTLHDAFVVGFFNFSGTLGAIGYHTFYKISLKFLENDPQREVGFGLVTNEKAAAKLGVEFMPSLKLVLWNETLEYPPDSEFTVDAVIKWISQHTHVVSVWVTPPGVKSLTLSPYVEEGSVLIMFTPRNPLLDRNFYYDMLREVGLEYYNCNNLTIVHEFAEYLSKKISDDQFRFTSLEADCLLKKSQEKTNIAVPPVQIIKTRWLNASACGKNKYKSKEKCHYTEPDLVNSVVIENPKIFPYIESHNCDNYWSFQKYILNLGPLSESSEHYCMCLKPGEWISSTFPNTTNYTGIKTSMLSAEEDDRSAPALLVTAEREKCRKIRRSQLVHEMKHYVKNIQKTKSITGLACKTNKTLSLLAMDSLQFHHFAEGLGVDVLRFKDKTAVVLFNAGHESAYILNKELSKSSLEDFILNYTNGLLNRTMRSTEVPYHFTKHHYQSINSSNCSQTENSTCVQELNSKTFQDVVMNPYQSVVLLYHSPYCAFCHSVSFTFLTIARYFQGVTNLTFARIDGENNDLPWEFTMDHYPSILYFPSYSKSDSRLFPKNAPITVPNLASFVLSNLGAGIPKLEGLLSLCSSWTLDKEDSKQCVAKVRLECLETINWALSRFRAATVHSLGNQAFRVKRKILMMLQQLKQIHLLLGTTVQLNSATKVYEAVHKCIHAYYNDVSKLNHSNYVRKTVQKIT